MITSVGLVSNLLLFIVVSSEVMSSELLNTPTWYMSWYWAYIYIYIYILDMEIDMKLVQGLILPQVPMRHVLV